MELIVQVVTLIAGIFTIVGIILQIIRVKKKKKNGVKNEQLSFKNQSMELSADRELPKTSDFYYITFLTSDTKGVKEFRKGDIKIELVNTNFTISDDFLEYNRLSKSPVNKKQYSTTGKCRLESYGISDFDQNRPANEYSFQFSRISYYDYLVTNNVLDETIPGKTDTTFRDKHANYDSIKSLLQLKLSNICGVGIFIITKDNKIIISKHSKIVSVYKDAYSYSASGTMDWKDDLHPFSEVIRECHEEIGHKPDMDDLYFFGFGLDEKKLYFQFSFFERTAKTSNQIKEQAPYARDYDAEIDKLLIIDFDLDSIINLIKNEYWEPAAAYNLIILCYKEFGKTKTDAVMHPIKTEVEIREKLKYVWDERAKRTGLLTVMSNRYPFEQLATSSQKYIYEVLSFIGNDINGKDIVEIGGGIGRLTKHFVNVANVTCVDISETMIKKNKEYLGMDHKKVNYIHSFAQDYTPRTKKHDVGVISLVLIHNTDDILLKKLANNISNLAEVLFIFEHVDIKQSSSNQTKLRTKNYLLSLFPEYSISKQQYYDLFDDNILFLKLQKNSKNIPIRT